ncbi:TPA: hypothetical protein ACIBKF_003205 [Salmonella enterica subsp. enterica serovar 6,7:y:-]
MKRTKPHETATAWHAGIVLPADYAFPAIAPPGNGYAVNWMRSRGTQGRNYSGLWRVLAGWGEQVLP